MDARSITTGHAHVRKPPASVCMVGHGRTFGLPAVHDSIANLLTVLKKHFVLHLAVVLLLTDSDSQPTFGQQIYGSTTCDGLQEGIKRLAPSILHLVNESSCAAFASMIGNRNAARASTRCQPNTLRMAWLQYCFESSPRASLYVRLRPDAFFAEPMSQLQSWRDLARTSEEAVASWVNTDCAGSDQVYAFNAPAYNGWWQRANREWWTSTMSHSRNTNFGGYPGSPEVSGAELNRVWTLMTVCPCLCAQFLLYGKGTRPGASRRCIKMHPSRAALLVRRKCSVAGQDDPTLYEFSMPTGMHRWHLGAWLVSDRIPAKIGAVVTLGARMA